MTYNIGLTCTAVLTDLTRWSSIVWSTAVFCVLLSFFKVEAASASKVTNYTIHPDLICFVCDASRKDCPVNHYKYPVAHLTTACHACYKEWGEGSIFSTRKCLGRNNLTEFERQKGNTTENWSGCSYKTDPVTGKATYFCLCREDYCNSSRDHHLSFSMVILLAFVSSYAWMSLGNIFNG